ncbi:MAG: pyridoxamine 5'-phosphate oxidase family protein [Solirubrobacterales bacterium]
MGKAFDRIDDHLRDWIGRQRLYFVGTAPLAAEGRVNVSPKGPIETLSVLDDRTVAYLDMVGSGAETIAHLRENGRIVVMLCAFEGPPRILRLHGRGRAVAADDPEFLPLLERAGFEDPHPITEARRAVIVVDVERIADSCGYGVPLMEYEGERPHMEAWAAKKMRVDPGAIEAYKAEKNSISLDGLPALQR